MTSPHNFATAQDNLELNRDRYVELGGTFCPFCNSLEIEYDEFNYYSQWFLQEVTCHNCHNTWTDRYKLVDFIPDTSDIKPIPTEEQP
jgi:hypothetical protein